MCDLIVSCDIRNCSAWHYMSTLTCASYVGIHMCDKNDASVPRASYVRDQVIHMCDINVFVFVIWLEQIICDVEHRHSWVSCRLIRTCDVYILVYNTWTYSYVWHQFMHLYDINSFICVTSTYLNVWHDSSRSTALAEHRHSWVSCQLIHKCDICILTYL